MSGVICAWASLPDDAVKWYESKYIADMCSQSAETAIHTQQQPNELQDGPISHLTAPWDLFTMYEVHDTRKAMECWRQKRNCPTSTTPAASLSNAHLDVRSYREVKRWQAQDWNGDVSDVTTIAVMEWTISTGMSEEVLSFYKSFVGPTLSSSPDILRFRFFELEDSMTWKGDTYTAQDRSKLHGHITLVELESEHWPWDVVVELGKNQQWINYFEKQTIVKWQVSDFHVKKTFPENSSARESNSDHKAG